jgi:hypothetical protein
VTVVVWNEVTDEASAQLQVAAYLASVVANDQSGHSIRQKKSCVAAALCRRDGDHPQTGGWKPRPDTAWDGAFRSTILVVASASRDTRHQPDATMRTDTLDNSHFNDRRMHLIPLHSQNTLKRVHQ